MKSGIYRIDVGPHFYFGRAASLNDRRLKHLSSLRCGNHVNTHLQNAYNKYGEFKFTVLAYCSAEFSVFLEQRLLDKYWGVEKCANIHSDAEGGACGADHPNSRGIIGVSEDGLTVVEWATGREAAKTLGQIPSNFLRDKRRVQKGDYAGFALGYSDDSEFDPNAIPTVGEHRSEVSAMCSRRPVHPNWVKHGDAHSQAQPLQLLHPDGSLHKKFGSVKSAASYIGKSNKALWHYYHHEKPFGRGKYQGYLLIKDKKT